MENKFPRVCIIVPVYRGIEETKACLESVLLSVNSKNVEIIVIDDCSPEKAIVSYCTDLASSGVVKLIQNKKNIGFVGSVNKAMRAAAGKDVVLLNSDTVVAGRWLEKLVSAAYSSLDIGTVTPFSNNAEICSYPIICQSNDLLPDLSLLDIDEGFSVANNGMLIDIPTAVGFCMYIKRSCLNAVGEFDEAAFGKGYGEENDFCLRASGQGWRHVLACDTFVYHKGSVSFLSDKENLVQLATQVIGERYPHYFDEVQQFIADDSIRLARDRVSEFFMKTGSSDVINILSNIVSNLPLEADLLDDQRASEGSSDINGLRTTEDFKDAMQRFFCSDKPKILFVTHSWGGGVEQHIQDLRQLISSDVNVFILRGLGSGGVELEIMPNDTPVRYDLGGFGSNSWEQWQEIFCAMGFSRVHLHHIQGWPREIIALIESLNIPIDITLHDFYAISPRFHMTEGGVFNSDESWPAGQAEWLAVFKNILHRADRVISPSQYVADRLVVEFPQVGPVIKAHPQKVYKAKRVFKIAILGALSPEKGLDVVKKVVELAKTQASQCVFTIIGYGSEPLDPAIHVTGSYDVSMLPQLLASERPDVIWFPAQVPETYSFTLTHALSYGAPIVASNFGAFPERLSGYKKSILLDFSAPPKEWLEALTTFSPEIKIGNEIWLDNTEEYRGFYLAPLDFSRSTSGVYDAKHFLDFLSEQPLAPKVKDTPLKYLFKFGVYCRHLPKIKEVERRLDVIPDLEAGVAGIAEHRDALERAESLHELSNKLRLSVDDLKIERGYLKNELRAVSEERDLLSSNLAGYKENVLELQTAAEMARRHIDHMESRVGDLKEEVSQMRLSRDNFQELLRSKARELEVVVSERNAMLSSFSWRVTRPLRILRRLIRSSPEMFRRFSSHIFRVSSYKRAVSLVRRGGVRELLNRMGYEARSAIDQEQALRHAIPAPVVVSEEKTLSELPAIKLASSHHPKISIVIPVYGQHETTFNCLSSIQEFPPSLPYEVIVADDASLLAASEALCMVTGVQFVRQESNLGFIENVNAGAAAATGEFLIILNNDTLVRQGSLNSLINTFTDHNDVGLVGAKLLNRDGTLQEAGGIIWQDGSGWNWGRNADPREPKFNYVRDVDYCSGAALAVRRELFFDLGGFDLRYKPAYYEDTDLAFKVRDKGLRVIYQPAAEIYHLEGISHGTDETSGVKSYQKINKDKFLQRWENTLSQHAPNAISPETEANRYTTGSVLIIEACMITPDQDSGSVRMLNLLKILKGQGCHVTFIADNLEYRKQYVDQITAIGVEVIHSPWFNSVESYLKHCGSRYDTVVLCRHYIAADNYRAVKKYAAQATVVFDTVDLHFVREEREAELSGDDYQLSQAKITKEQELDLVKKTDLTLVVSPYEQKLLSELCPGADVAVISNIHSHRPERPGISNRKDILFVGGFRHTPNIDAVMWYADYVWPLIQERLPGVATIVVGSNMPEQIKKLSEKGINVRGFVEDIEPLLKSARISIAPLRYGAGVKGKVNEAMNYGIPVVATTCAVEGMYLVAGEDVMVGDAPEDFCEALVKAYSDEALWNKLSAAGVVNVERFFSPEAALPSVKRMLRL